MNLTQTMQGYFNDLSSNSPTPGGGNVAALCGALSSSLGIMVCNLTIGKKKYVEVEQDMISVKEKLEQFQLKYIELGNKDNEAFEKVMEAFKMPKETDDEKEKRSKKIEEATIGAAEIPYNVMTACSEILPLLKIVIQKGNKNSLSDAGVAASLISTSAKAAYLNVLINCAALNNQTVANELKKRAEILMYDISKFSGQLVQQVEIEVQPH
jgi:methenyltetrahydrofolate cyclohydrolase